MFNIRFIVAILVVFIFVINVNGQVNDLKLTRLFLKVHKERLAEEALEEASLKEPGEHNHDLSEILNQLDNNPAIQQQFQQFQQNGLPPQLFQQQQQQQQLPPRMFQQQPPQMQQQQQPKPNPFVNARLPQSQLQQPQPQVQNNNNRVPQSIQQQQQQQQQQQLMFQNQPTNAFGVQPQQAQPTMQRQVQQPIVQSQRQQPVQQVFGQPPMVQPQPQQQQPQNLMNNFNKFTSNSQSINNFAMTGIKVAERLLNTAPTNPNDPAVTNLNDLSKLKAPARFCPFKQQQQTKCDPQFPYRSLDGSCNNLNNFWWGRAESPFKRYLDPDYSDQFKLNDPRASKDGSELPNPRELACNLHTDSEEMEPIISHMFMQWGQLLNHDITSISSQPHEDDKSKCTTCTRTSKCLPIQMNTNATSCSCPVRMTSRGCIEFTRSSASFGDLSCSLGRREQLNLQTGFLDGSHIYGVNQEQLESLRDRTTSGTKGLLRTQLLSNGHHMLPSQQTDKPSDCLDFTPTTKCFHAGDDRVNQNPSLMSMQTLFVREHNRIATILAKLNPSWDDETVFQETRRIIIATIQHITYSEYLPVLLGQRNMQRFSLQPQTGFNFFTLYNNTIDPRIANEYSAAAGRFGHSTIRSEYSRVNSNFTTAGTQSFILRNSYFRANALYDQCQGGLESIVRGMLKDPVMKVDRHFSTDLTQHLFEVRDRLGRPFHFDLVSINIMRGRDHGIPSYTRYREFCGLQPVKSWNDLTRFIPDDAVSIMRRFYRFVEDIDLFVAGVSEFKEENSQLGPTFSCILGLQFQHLKFGDRFWYETSDFPANFTPGQLAEIRRITLSQFLCRTMINTPQIQPRAMLTRQLTENQLISCDSLPDINWDLWKTG